MKLEFTEQEIQILGKALGLLPYVEVSGLITNLSKQLQEKEKPNEG